MGTVTIQEYTTKSPITMIGKEAGVCWGADTSDDISNYKRGLACLNDNHGRTFEFPDVYMIFDGYSARVIREWYTHIGGSPTRLQASTRYIDYKDFNFTIPPTVNHSLLMKEEYLKAMDDIKYHITKLIDMGLPKEDAALLLPLGMSTRIVCKHNLRNLIDMSHQRMCNRAYWEYRQLYKDICNQLKTYSNEWKYLVENYFKPKCELCDPPICPESKGCGKYPNKKR